MNGSQTKDAQLRQRAEVVIPGGMYGHQSTMALPDDYPQYFSRGKGAYLWDADGNRYLDLMCAYGPQLFGYAHECIDAKAIEQIRQGDPLTSPTEFMVALPLGELLFTGGLLRWTSPLNFSSRCLDFNRSRLLKKYFFAFNSSLAHPPFASCNHVLAKHS